MDITRFPRLLQTYASCGKSQFESLIGQDVLSNLTHKLVNNLPILRMKTNHKIGIFTKLEGDWSKLLWIITIHNMSYIPFTFIVVKLFLISLFRRKKYKFTLHRHMPTKAIIELISFSLSLAEQLGHPMSSPHS